MKRCSTYTLRHQLLLIQGALSALFTLSSLDMLSKHLGHALSSLDALNLSLEPACRREAAGSGLKVGPTEADVEDAAGGAADVECAARRAYPGA